LLELDLLLKTANLAEESVDLEFLFTLQFLVQFTKTRGAEVLR
jgi:hypothetical protein